MPPPVTRSPARTPLTPGPTAWTWPAYSLPGVNGTGTDT